MHEYRQLSGKNLATDSSELPNEVVDEIYAGQETPIKILRKYRKVTQADLAKAAGLSRPYLTEIESGKKNGSVKALTHIANALDVPVSLLVIKTV
jgi:DNA-binding XRE family transcriptional regulator